MEKFFKVAEHNFKLDMPGGSELWGKLQPYEPFQCEPSEDLLFSLKSVGALPECGAEVIYDEEPEQGMPRIQIARNDNHWRISVCPPNSREVCSEVQASTDFKEAEIAIFTKESESAFALNNAMMLLYAFASAPLGTLEMHASVVRHAGKGYLFLGHSGAGKSTHSRQWLKAIPDTLLMNDDNPVVRVSENGRINVYGSPWSGKTPCYRNISAPIGGFARIVQAPHNLLKKMSLVESYAMVYSSCSGFKADRKIADGLHATIEKIAANIGCYTMECLPDEDAARVCAKGMGALAKDE